MSQISYLSNTVTKRGVDLKSEAAALIAFKGYGVVQLLEHTTDALLLERILPGTSLEDYFPKKDTEAVLIACQVIKRLHQAPLPKAGVFPSLDDWLAVLDQDWPIPIPYLQKAHLFKERLLKTTTSQVLLHGDLHHQNILKGNNGWVVIDPKGVIGDPSYEAGAFIRNPIPMLLETPHAADLIKERITLFAHTLDLDAQRLTDWCFVQAVLAWIWSIEDGGNEDYFRELVEVHYNLG
jgi:streptomycin 6-kinase